MSMNCTRCEGSGFLNIDQVLKEIVDEGADAVLAWIDERNSLIESRDCSCHIRPPCVRCEAMHDVAVCDCCGDGNSWYGTPGQHYTSDDQRGPKGPYASNGGLCHCH